MVSQQGRGNTGPAPIGVLYNTSMSRPDAALALALMYAMEGRRDAKVNAVCVSGSGLSAAIFCDVVSRSYVSARNSNTAVLPGLAVTQPLPADPPMVMPAVEKKNDANEPHYPRTIARLTDTAQAEALLRNALTFSAENVEVLSAAATNLARTLELGDGKALYKERVRRLVLVDAGDLHRDPTALGRLLSDCPAPMVYCGREIGEALRFPGEQLEKVFAWAGAGHPVADAYRAFKPAPYNAPMHDVMAAHYALHPDSGFFTLSNPGSLALAGDGTISFTEGTGTVRRMMLDAAKKDQAMAAVIALLSAPAVVPAGRGGRGAANA